MTQSNSETTQSSSPNGSDSSSRGLLSALLHWIKSYGGLSGLEKEQQSLETTERETRRNRIETRYRTAIIQFQLNPNNLHRNQLADILALLEEYRDTL
jgi:hypothetical protein